MDFSLTLIFDIILPCGIAAICALQVRAGLRDGFVIMRGETAARTENPVYFWFLICVLAVFGVLATCFTAVAAFALMFPTGS